MRLQTRFVGRLIPRETDFASGITCDDDPQHWDAIGNGLLDPLGAWRCDDPGGATAPLLGQAVGKDTPELGVRRGATAS
jgi:hypothetical protein